MSDAAAALSAARQPHPAPSLRVLLYAIVDYAGLFPPASLDMAAATREYAAQRGATDAWALGRFVLPAARLEEFETASKDILPRDAAGSWALSALLGSDLEEDLGRIERFNERHADARQGAVLVDTVELKTHTPRDVMRASDLLDRRFDTYMEVPMHEDPAEMIAAIAQTVAKAKIRTGGVTLDAFPTGTQVLRFIQRCIAHDVAFKATAGLHHPWRGEYRLTYAADAPRGTMFGFLNVLLCTAALLGGVSEDVALAVLEERDGRAVAFDGEGARWRGQRFDTELLERARERMAAFGSCSFREPMDDLRAAQLL